jgi:N-glycosylase/DNA lyase
MRGEIDLGQGELDLDKTLQSGQTFSWRKLSGEPFFEPSLPNERFYQVLNGEVVIVWQEENVLHYLTSGDISRDIGSFFLLDQNLDEIFSTFPMEEPLQDAYEKHRGLRVVNDRFLPTLIAFICSQRMSIPRIKRWVDRIMNRYGDCTEFAGRQFPQFPTLEQLSEATESELDDLGLGYRGLY